MKRTTRRIIIIAASLLLLVVGPAITLVMVARANEVTSLQLLSHAGHWLSRVGKTPRSAPAPAETRNGRWQQDLSYLASELPRLHVNAFHSTSKASFEAAIARLEARIPELADHEVIVELMRVIALIGDGHTTSWTWTQHFQRYPVMLRWLQGELYIVAADEARRELLGARVVGIGNATAQEALERVRPLTSYESEGDFLGRAQLLLSHAEILRALGLQDSLEYGMFTLETREGQFVTVTLEPKPAAAPLELQGAGPRPFYQTQPEASFWMAYLPNENIVYLRYNRCRDSQGFRALTKELLETIDAINPALKWI